MLPQSNVVVINNREVVFAFKGEKPFISSRDLAAVFEKRHDNVISAIRALPQDSFCFLNFKEVETEYKNPHSGGVTKYPAYQMTRDGFALLAMGFTGEKAHKWKIAFIGAFNQMEAELKNRASADSSALSASIEKLAIALSEIAEAIKATNRRVSLVEDRTFNLETRIALLEGGDPRTYPYKTHTRKFTDVERSVIVDMRRRGYTLSEIGGYLRCSHSRIHKFINREMS
jgi:Rha family phage regulatory protein